MWDVFSVMTFKHHHAVCNNTQKSRRQRGPQRKAVSHSAVNNLSVSSNTDEKHSKVIEPSALKLQYSLLYLFGKNCSDKLSAEDFEVLVIAFI